jgi:hypothetical protein
MEQFVTAMPQSVATATAAAGGGAPAQNTPSATETAIDTKYNLGTTDQNAPPGAAPAVAASPDEMTITVVCRALKGPSDTANSDLMYALLDEFKASPLVDAKATQVGSKIVSDDSRYTFTFAVKLALKNSPKF